MRTITICFLVFLSAACCLGRVRADGNELLPKCAAVVSWLDKAGGATHDLDVGYCSGFITAVLDVNELWKLNDSAHSLKDDFKWHVCVPSEGIDIGQATRIVVKWLREHPQELHKPAGALVLAALQPVFPCKDLLR